MALHPALTGEPIRRIAVFRALVLGDLLCATPTLRALKAAWPDAELTLIGLPWARAWAARLASIDRFEEFPGLPGLPEREPEPAALPAFIERMRAERFDLLVQLHGSGSIVNAFLGGLGARHVAGFVDPGAYCAEPALHVPWPRVGHEIDRLLCLTDHLGLPRRGRQLDFPVTPGDRHALQASVPEIDLTAPYVCVHPGAQLPSRRWPAERFARVADRLAARGMRIVLTGTASEAALTRQVARAMRADALDLAGRTGLWTLGALLDGARLLVCNDTGVLHVAAALGTPSVAVSSGADVARWAPLDLSRHVVLWRDLPCRPCSHRVCPTLHECATGVGAADVAYCATSLANTPRPERRLPASVASHIE